MNNIDLQAIARQITEAGATPPGDLLDIAADHEAAKALVGVGLFVPASRGGAPALVRDEFVQAALDGSLDAPLTEAMLAAAEKAAVQEQVVAIWRELDKRLQVKAAKIVRAAGDALIEEVQPAFAEAVAKLAKVVELIGPDPDLVEIFDSGDEAKAEAYRTTRVEAQDEVDRLLRIRTGVLAPLSYGERAISVAWVLDPAHTWDPASLARAKKTWDKANVPSDRIGHLLAAGFPVTLNTHAQSESIQEGVASRAAAKAKAQRNTEEEQAQEERRLRKAEAGVGAKK